MEAKLGKTVEFTSHDGRKVSARIDKFIDGDKEAQLYIEDGQWPYYSVAKFNGEGEKGTWDYTKADKDADALKKDQALGEPITKKPEDEVQHVTAPVIVDAPVHGEIAAPVSPALPVAPAPVEPPSIENKFEPVGQ